MILFQPEHAEMILSGRKTQTRRLGKSRWQVGAVHQCYTRPPFVRPPGKPFARVRIIDVQQLRLGSISHADVLAEGYSSAEEYFEVFARVNGCDRLKRQLLLDMRPWVVSFEKVWPV